MFLLSRSLCKMLKDAFSFSVWPYRYGKCCCLVFFIFIAALSVSADHHLEIIKTHENQRFIQKIYTTADGLPQNTAKSMLQAKNGYIWIATFGGLSRFDGLEFKNYTPSNTPALTDNRLTTLFEDDDGVLWIGSEGGNLFKYDGGKFSFVFSEQENTADLSFRSILADRSGRLWINKLSELISFDPTSGQITKIKIAEIDLNTTKAPSYFTDAVIDGEGNLLVGSNAGIFKVDAFTQKVSIYDPLIDSEVITLKFDEAGTLWFFGAREIFRFADRN